MNRPPRWMDHATRPTDAEVGRLVDGPDPALRDLAIAATEPLPEEVEALLRRSRMPARSRRPRVALWIPAALVAVAVMMVVLLWPASEVQPVFVATGTGAWHESVTDDGDVVVVQADGVVRYEVSPRPRGQRFVVRAQDVEVVVVGTVFDVGIEADGVWVLVLEGVVEVTRGARRARLLAGDRWEASEEGVAALPPAGDVPVREVTEYDVAVVPVQAPASPSPMIEVAVATEPIGAPTAPVTSPAEQLATLLGRVESGERTADLGADLAAWSSSHGGPLAEDALAASVEVMAALGDPEDAVLEIDRAIAASRRGPRRLALVELKAHLLRDRMHDCSRALPGYRTLAEEASGAQRSRALAWRGLCAAGIGRSDEARTSLQAALDAGLTGTLHDEVQLALLEMEEP